MISLEKPYSQNLFRDESERTVPPPAKRQATSIERRVQTMASVNIPAPQTTTISSPTTTKRLPPSSSCLALCCWRLSRCYFRNACTAQNVESEIADKFDFLGDFSSAYQKQALSADIPGIIAETQMKNLHDRVVRALEGQKTEALHVIRSFHELRSLFPSVDETEFSCVPLEVRQRFLWIRPLLESSDHRLLSSECWTSLVYMLGVMPPSGRFVREAFNWLKNQAAFPDLPSLIRAVGYASQIPLCSWSLFETYLREETLPVRPWMIGVLGADEYSRILEMIVRFRERALPLLQAPVERWSRLLPRGLAQPLFAARSPLHIEWLILVVRKIFLTMPAHTQKTLLSLDAGAILAIFASRAPFVWPAREEDAIAELLIVFAHVQHLGFGGSGASHMVVDALQEVREEILLTSDPFLLEHPLFDPSLAVLSLSDEQCEAIRACLPRRKDLKTALRALVHV
jgi:hypothetical protein